MSRDCEIFIKFVICIYMNRADSTIRKSSKSGFTLLEMLVVIGIIAILITLGIASYSTVQKKSRDARRKGDLKTIQNALESYYSICGFNYPTPASFGSENAFTNIQCVSPATDILPTVPVDPKTVTPYPCQGCSDSNYSICATLESEADPNYCLNNTQ